VKTDYNERSGILDYNQSIAYLNETAAMKRIKHSFNTLTAICEAFSHPQEKLKIIHVAGTNGKGSACAMLSCILTEAGFKTGVFSSPHLARYNERLAVGGKHISDADFAEVLSRVVKVSEEYLNANASKNTSAYANTDTNANASPDRNRLSFFELLTIMAFVYFYESGVDFAIIETGMGGRLDSTNIVTKPVLSVVTSIGLDHTEILGDTIQSIAQDKAGIIKKNCPAVLYLNTKEVYNIIKGAAEELNAKFYYANRVKTEISAMDLNGSVFSAESEYYSYTNIRLNLFGAYQIENACGAFLAIRALNACGVEISREHVFAALNKIYWPCRMEIINGPADDSANGHVNGGHLNNTHTPLILLDGAHNADGALAFDNAMSYFDNRSRQSRIILLCGLMRDKPYEAIIKNLGNRADIIIATRPDSPRALAPETLSSAAKQINACSDRPKEVLTIENYREAMKTAFDIAAENDIICVAGSLYLVGAIRHMLQGF